MIEQVDIVYDYENTITRKIKGCWPSEIKLKYQGW